MNGKYCMLMLAFLSSFVFAQNKSNIKLKNGDILFCSSEQGELSKAIDKVTKTAKSTNYSHMGMVLIEGENIFVYHAAPKLGVCKQRLEEFLTGEYAQIDAYRLKDEYQYAIQKGSDKVKPLVGQEYDYTYVLESPGYYCSELIATIFESDSIFQYNPMTFKNPNTGEFNETWIKHYQKFGMDIPEGKPGCNPNGMAASENLEFVGRVK
jgi:hypothetical protein